jgi:hypothetical protein
LCALGAGFAPARAAAIDACGRPEGHAHWIDYGRPEFASIFGRPGTILAVSSGDFPAQMRAAGALTVYWDMYLSRRVGTPTEPADPTIAINKANALYEYAAAQTSCSTPWIALNELFGSSLPTPWSDWNAQYRANVLAFVKTLAARGARPFLLVNSKPYMGGEAAAWWQQVAAVSDIVRETYLNAKKLYAQGPIAANRTLRQAMRKGIGDFTAIGIPPEKLGVMLGFQTTPKTGGREGLVPKQAWMEVVKWQALSARQVAADIPISSIWSWGWGPFTKAESDPDKAAAACVWLWTRAHPLCDGPAVAGTGWDESTTEGQIRLGAGVQCTVGRRAITDGAIDDLQHLTGDREIAYSALLARAVDGEYAVVGPKQILAAERAVIATRFNGSAAAYRDALVQAGASVNVARGILGDELRRFAISRTLNTRAPSAAEIATFYESYPDLLVRPVSAKPAPAWLGGKLAGFALDSIAPDGIFELRGTAVHTVRTISGTFKVKVTGEARALGTMPLSLVTPAIRSALSYFARGVKFSEWTVGRQHAALSETTCRKDELPVPASVELESFVPALSATGA